MGGTPQGLVGRCQGVPDQPRRCRWCVCVCVCVCVYVFARTRAHSSSPPRCPSRACSVCSRALSVLPTAQAGVCVCVCVCVYVCARASRVHPCVARAHSHICIRSHVSMGASASRGVNSGETWNAVNGRQGLVTLNCLLYQNSFCIVLTHRRVRDSAQSF